MERIDGSELGAGARCVTPRRRCRTPGRSPHPVRFRQVLSVALLGALMMTAWPAGAVDQPTPALKLAWLADDPDFVDVSAWPRVHTNLRYATDHNFLKTNIYGDFNRCFLHRVAADKLGKAAALLAGQKPGWKFLVFDCLRPRSIQEKLYAVVAGTAQQAYVANPRSGSIHNFGLAIDLSLQDQDGREVDMGTAFDDFSSLSEPRLEKKFLAEGRLSRQQHENRLLLRGIMEGAGFIQLANEWWHYDALPKTRVRANYKIVE